MNVKRLAIMYTTGDVADKNFVKSWAPRLTDEEFAKLVENVRRLDGGEVTVAQMEIEAQIEKRKQQILNGQHPVHGVDTVASICVGVAAHTGNTLVFVRYEKPGAVVANIESQSNYRGDVKIVWQWNRDNVAEALQ